MGGALGALVGLGFELFGLKARTREAGEKQGLRLSGPEGNSAARAESTADHGESLATVDTRIFGLHERGGTVIHIQKDSVVLPCSIFDAVEDIAGQNLYAAIIKKFAIQILQKLAIPCDDLGSNSETCAKTCGPLISSTRRRLKPRPKPPIRTVGRSTG